MRIRMWTALFVAGGLMAVPPSGASPDDSSGTGYLGVHLQRVEGGLAEALGMKSDGGVLLGQVLADSPAEAGGLRSGDIVVSIDGQRVGTPTELREAVGGREPGVEVKIGYLRDGDKREATVKLGEAPVVDRTEREHVRHPGRMVKELKLTRDRGYLGVLTQPLSGDLGEYFGVKDGNGALVSRVEEESPASKLGLEAGDVIVKVDDRDIEDPEDLQRAIRDFEEETEVEIAWVRDHKERHGKTKLEIREGRTPRLLSRWSGEGPGPHHDFDLEDFEDIDIGEHLKMLKRHVGDGIERIREIRVLDDGELDEQLGELRAEIEKLRSEIEEMKGQTGK